LREGAEAAKTEIDQAIRSLKASHGELATAQQRLALLEEGTRLEEIAEARAVLSEAEQALVLLQRGYRPEDIAKAAAQVDAARAAIAAIERQIAELTVISPCDCVVEAVDLQPGDLLNANAPAVSLVDASRLWVRAYVPEGRLGQIQLGQKVDVSVDSFPNEQFDARVTFIAHEAEFTPRNVQTPEERSKQVFRLKVTLDEGLDRLRIGMTADVWLENDALR
jgi:multidrug resistance efflux pump